MSQKNPETLREVELPIVTKAAHRLNLANQDLERAQFSHHRTASTSLEPI